MYFQIYLKVIIINMSDSDKDGSDKEELNEEDLSREIEGNCYKAFQAFDPDGNGGQIKSDQFK